MCDKLRDSRNTSAYGLQTRLDEPDMRPSTRIPRSGYQDSTALSSRDRALSQPRPRQRPSDPSHRSRDVVAQAMLPAAEYPEGSVVEARMPNP